MIKSALAKLLAVIVGTSAVTSCNGEASRNQNSGSGLSVELLVIEQTVGKQAPFTFQYSIRNGTAEAVRLLPWGTPLEEELMADSFNVEYQGELLPYTGRMVKRMAPLDADYITLSADETLTVTVDLTKAYNTSLPGKYTVQIKTFDDIYSITTQFLQCCRNR